MEGYQQRTERQQLQQQQIYNTQQPPIGIHPQDVFSPPNGQESRSFNFSSSFHNAKPEQNQQVGSLQQQAKTKTTSALLQESSHVYSAVYSGVSVYEMMCRNVAVMRRQKDSFLNATQVLKVANIDKGKRTKILEKEILNKEHEKVQGGYGKYQGTWIPFERGFELAKQFRVDDVLAPLFEFPPGSHPTRTLAEPPVPVPQPPPPARAPAPRRNAHNNNVAANNLVAPVTGKPNVVESVAKRMKMDSIQTYTESPETNNHRDLYLEGTGSSFEQQQTFFEFHDPKVYAPNPHHVQQMQQMHQQHHYQGYYNMDPYGVHHQQFNNHHMPSNPHIAAAAENNGERHRSAIISLFVNPAQGSTSQELFLSPQVLMAPDFDINLLLDEQGHTALHWAAALGNVALIPPLLQKGCRIDSLNVAGESALLRSVMVPSNYEHQTFMDLLSLLKDIICIPDAKNRTVLHHICLTASLKGGVNSCIYYMQCLLDFYAKSAHDEVLSSEMVHSDNNNSFSSRFRSILDVVDICGDTAVNIAARIGNRHLFDLLVRAGANVSIPNYASLKPSDYGFEPLKNSMDSQANPVVTTVLYPSIKSDQENAAYSDPHMPDFTEKSQSEIIAELQTQLNSMSREISHYRKTVEPLEMENAEIPLLKYRISVLENAVKEKANSNNIITENGVPAFSSKEEYVNEEIHRLKEALAHQKAVEGHLCQEIKALRAMSSQHESFCKRIISESCNVPLENVAEILQPLLDAIETEDAFNLDARLVSAFMKGIRESAPL